MVTLDPVVPLTPLSAQIEGANRENKVDQTVKV
jgi:hypothetical protein